jgi:predicted lipoprotein with Yx(FWY)xxD motif
VIPLAALVVAGCGGGGGNAKASAAPPKTTTVSARTATVRVANSRLGKILVDSRGHTLYLFKRDSGKKSACFGACATFWPPLRANGKPTVGGGARASLVGTTARSDGARQVTYNGHPLYRFAQDKKPGDTNGEGVNAFGGRWFVVSASGKQVTRQASKSRSVAATARPQPAPPAAPQPTQPAPPPPPPPAAAPAPQPSNSNGIPQNGGGDGDADNNGGPSDGDGGV